MQFYYISKKNNKKGPFTLLQIRTLISEEKIDENTFAWHSEMDKWEPISNIPSLENFLKEKEESYEINDEKSLEYEKVPGNKFFLKRSIARLIDLFIYIHLLFFIILVSSYFSTTVNHILKGYDLLNIQSNQFENIKNLFESKYGNYIVTFQIISIIIFHVIEAISIYFFNTTLGKALLGIKIIGINSDKIPLSTSLLRSFYVLFIGLGMYNIVYFVILMIFNLFIIYKNNNCLWDNKFNLKIVSYNNKKVKLSISVILVICFLVINYFFNYIVR